MTRKRLWSLTAIACLMMVIPGLALKAEGQRLKAFGDRLSEIDLTSALHATRSLLLEARSPQLAALAATLMLMLTVAVLRRRRTRADLATALARRGRPVPAIARQTRLSQDAIRDLLGGEPMAVPTGLRGRIFRRRPKTSGSTETSFAEELSEKAWDARA